MSLYTSTLNIINYILTPATVVIIGLLRFQQIGPTFGIKKNVLKINEYNMSINLLFDFIGGNIEGYLISYIYPFIRNRWPRANDCFGFDVMFLPVYLFFNYLIDYFTVEKKLQNKKKKKFEI